MTEQPLTEKTKLDPEKEQQIAQTIDIIAGKNFAGFRGFRGYLESKEPIKPDASCLFVEPQGPPDQKIMVPMQDITDAYNLVTNEGTLESGTKDGVYRSEFVVKIGGEEKRIESGKVFILTNNVSAWRFEPIRQSLKNAGIITS